MANRRQAGWWLALALWAAPAGAQDAPPEVNGQAPMFRLPVYNAKTVGAAALGLEKYVGADHPDKATKVVLLSFMASFCAPCKKELPWLQATHERYQAQGLRVVLVSIDTEPEGQKLVEQLVEANKVTFPVLKDRFNLVARRWLGAQSPLPSVFLLRPSGAIAAVHRGYSEEAGKLLDGELRALLGLAAAP